MWKFVFVLLVTALALLVAQLIADAPVIQTRVGALHTVQVTYAYAGCEGVRETTKATSPRAASRTGSPRHCRRSSAQKSCRGRRAG